MATTLTTDALAPVAPQQRIAALDVVRGFALLGIFLMNIEWFNRPITELGAGLPTGVAGLDHAVGWVVHTFVRSKFWTLFSLLFGMGFAVMLARAASAGRGFLAPYLRRTVALAVFGLAHGVLLWTGDILLSYASAAVLLLLALFGRAWHGLALLAVLAVAALVLDAPTAGLAGVVVVALLVSLYLRSEFTVRIGEGEWPLLSAIFGGLGVAVVLAGIAGMVLQGPEFAAALPFGGMLLATAWLSRRYRRPGDRMLWAGSWLYFAPVLAMLIGVAAAMSSPAGQQAQRTPEEKQQVEERRAEHRAKVAEEQRIMTSGRYAEAVRFRTKEFLGDYAGNAGFLSIVLSLFLVGAWFVQSGTMVEPGRHLRTFRRLAFVALPLGAVAAVVSSLLATSHAPGGNDAVWQVAMGLQLLGALPMALGYLGVLVLLLQSRAWARLLGWLAPAGRMALTNYLSQTVVCSLVFYGYGFGQWGMPRAWQVVFVAVVFAVQVLLSHWWLRRFRYGPLEWLWRAVTYLQLPRMRQVPMGQPA
jgi:uncharacterized membrane protein YeiB